MPPDSITLNPANKKTDESLADFETDIGTAGHATFDTEQLISCTIAILVDTSVSLQDSDGGMVAALELHELLTNINDIVSSAVS